MKEAVLTKNVYIPLDNGIKTHFNPKYVFIPIYENDILNVFDNKYVYKNSEVIIRENGKKVYSPISGIVLGVKDMLYFKGKFPSIVIENDFKENTINSTSIKKNINDYDLKEFIDRLKETGLSFKGNYAYEKFINNNFNLLINGVEKEPYFGCKYFLLKDNVIDILETVDLIRELFNVDKTIIAIKNNDNEIINAFMSELGTYPGIELRLVPNEYPLGIDDYLREVVGLDNANVLDIREIVDIYNCLKKGESPKEELITITGDAIDSHSVYNVKKGSLLSEVFENNIKFTEKSVNVYLNGMMTGKNVDTLQYVIDEDIDGVFITKKKRKIELECQNCGMCHKCCPRGLNPKYVCDHDGKVKPIYKEKCLQCGLCNFVCPSNRDLSKYMR